jgi:hypothetical protein
LVKRKVLATYENSQVPEELHQRILGAFKAGVSCREQNRLHGKNTPGISWREVSRL